VAIFYPLFLGENFWKIHGAHNWCHAGRDSESIQAAPPTMLSLSLQ